MAMKEAGGVAGGVVITLLRKARSAALISWWILRTPVLQIVDLGMTAWLRRRGYSVVETFALDKAREALADAGQYADRSGHLNTVKGRRPRAVERVVGSMGAAYVLTRAARPMLGRGALPPSKMLRPDPMEGVAL